MRPGLKFEKKAVEWILKFSRSWRKLEKSWRLEMLLPIILLQTWESWKVSRTQFEETLEGFLMILSFLEKLFLRKSFQNYFSYKFFNLNRVCWPLIPMTYHMNNSWVWENVWHVSHAELEGESVGVWYLPKQVNPPPSPVSEEATLSEIYGSMKF